MHTELDAVLAANGKATKAKLSSPSVTGAPEDQLRAPLEAMVKGISGQNGLSPDRVVLVGEHHLADSRSRPDYAVLVDGALVGFIEIKAPGK